MEYICQQCKRIFHDRKRPDRIIKYCSSKCYGKTKMGRPSWNKGIPMREETKEKFRKLFKGKRHSTGTEFTRENSLREKNRRWKGGRHKMSNGYIAILQPHHPRASARGYVCEHILVAEKVLGRFLQPNEVIHHLNEDKTDNHPENLYLFQSNGEHIRHHKKKIKDVLVSNLTCLISRSCHK